MRSNPAQAKVREISISSAKMGSRRVGVSQRGVTLNISVKAPGDPVSSRVKYLYFIMIKILTSTQAMLSIDIEPWLDPASLRTRCEAPSIIGIL